MRHRKNFNHLSRTSSHRKAMLSNMATSLILHKRINTTVAKAKALRSYVEPLITRSKEDTTHQRRVVFSYLQSKEAVTELFREISPKVAERPGGYTRIIKTVNRLGDNADMCLMELVDYNEHLLVEKESATEKPTGRRRRRGSGKGSKDETTTTKAPVAEKVIDKAETEKDEPAIVEPEVKEPEVTESEVEVKPAPEAEVKTEPEVEEKPEPEAEIKTEPEAEVKADEEKKPADAPEVKAEAGTDAEPEKKEPEADDESKEKKAE